MHEILTRNHRYLTLTEFVDQICEWYEQQRGLINETLTSYLETA